MSKFYNFSITFLTLSMIEFQSTFTLYNTSYPKNDIVWIDLETTGLNISQDHILEIACVITDDKLNIKNSTFLQVIHQPDDILDNMVEWSKKQHNQSGLTQEVKKSNVSIEQAEQLLLNFFEQHDLPKKDCKLGGNAVYFDQLFIEKYMPILSRNYLHYKIIDVSTVNELAERWNPDVAKAATVKKYNHRAYDDIIESINELKYYQNYFFKINI